MIILSLFFVLVATPLVVISTRVIAKLSELSQQGWQNTQIYKLVEATLHQAESLAGSWGVPVSLDQFGSPAQLVATAGSWLMTSSTAVASRAPEFVLALFVFSCALFFFLTESRSIGKAMERLDLLSVKELREIVRIIQQTSFITLISTASIGTVQALLVALAGWITGFSEILLIFIFTLMFSFIPVVGAAPGAVVLALLCFFQSDVSGGIVMLVAAGIVGVTDNILKPIILKGTDEDLNPVISLLAIIGAVMMYGLPGLLLGPILMRLTFKIIPILFEENASEVSVPPS